MSEKDILAVMVKAFNTEMNKAGIPDEVRQQKYSLRDVVNLASMVELEAVFPEEQPRIAQVFLRRLHLYMPIQSDTTIQYILGTQKQEVTIADTKIQSPYNTYLHDGLPPGPIGSPSLRAIQAVLHPEASDYLYLWPRRMDTTALPKHTRNTCRPLRTSTASSPDQSRRTADGLLPLAGTASFLPGELSFFFRRLSPRAGLRSAREWKMRKLVKPELLAPAGSMEN